MLPSEKAFAYKIQLEALKQKSGRPSKVNSGQVDPNLKTKRSNEIVAENAGESVKQIQRFIRLTFLIKPLLDMIDSEEIPFTAAVNLSYLKSSEQALLHKYVIDKKLSITLGHSMFLKAYSESDSIGYTALDEVFGDRSAKGSETAPNAAKKKAIKIKFEKLSEYIEAGTPEQDIEGIILEALKLYSQGKRV